MEMEIGNWIQKYDTHMGEKQVSSLKCFALTCGDTFI